jgi:hypothetical protein
MLDDLDAHVDRTEGRLGKVTKTINEFIRKNEGAFAERSTQADRQTPRARGA